MPGRAVHFRFPTHVEIRYSEEAPGRGDVVSGGGGKWVVHGVETFPTYVICTLLPWETESQVEGHGLHPPAPGSPVTVGSPPSPVDPTVTAEDAAEAAEGDRLVRTAERTGVDRGG